MYASLLTQHHVRTNLNNVDLTSSGLLSTGENRYPLRDDPLRWTRVLPVPGGKLVIEAEGEEPQWFLATAQALVELLYLQRDWDSYGALPINPEAVRFTLQLLSETMQADTPAPRVIPTTHGGVQLEWHIRGIDLEVEIQEPERIYVSYEDHRSGTEWETELAFDLTRLSDAISELSRRG